MLEMKTTQELRSLKFPKNIQLIHAKNAATRRYIPTNKICSIRPVNITKSATYIIDVTKLKHPDDVKRDLFGKWEYVGSCIQNIPYCLWEIGSM